MKMHNPWWRLGAVAAILLLVAGSLTGCANWFDGSDDGGGGGSSSATTSSVADALDQRLDNIDRDLTLWNIQPGLGTIMIEYGKRMFMMQKAVEAGDWGMASYQLKEALEIQEVGEVTRPTNADKLKAFESTFLDPISDDIQNKDATQFDTDFAAAIAGCNVCHAETGHPYIAVQAATLIPEVNVEFASSDPVAPSGESTFTDPTLPFPSGQVLTGAEVGDLIDFYLNTLNRNLALWNIQPGLGTVMIEYALRFAMMNEAAQAENWGMAQYQLKEALEIQEVGEFTRSNFAVGLKAFEDGSLGDLDQAIIDQDIDAFDTAYASAIDGCNECHKAFDHPFVRVTMPSRSPEPIISLSPSDASPPSEESAFPADAPVIPDAPTLDDAKTAIDYRLNHIDRNLALWNLQPGLGTVMIEYGERMTRLWFAVQAGNWDMAAYQLKEALEIQETGEVTRSAHADQLKAFETTYLDPIDTDIQNQDQAQFEADFTAALTGCNACHATTGHSYITVQTPSSVVDYLKLDIGTGSASGGAALFESNCGACHTGNGMGSGTVGPDITGATAADITSAIDTVGLMSSLSTLDADEIQSIADAL